MKRREYKVNIEFNDIRITKVIIDPHYEEKHSSSINDEIRLNGKLYKMIWLLEDHQIYIGVINTYRR